MMKKRPPARPAAALLIGAALLATPALAQDATQTAPPPDIAQTPIVVPPPVVPTHPEAVAPSAEPATDAPAPRARTVVHHAARTQTAARTVTTTRSTAPQSTAAAPARPTPAEPAAPASAPVTDSTAPVATTPAAPPAAPAAAPADTTSEQQTTTRAPIWPWVVGGLAVLALLAGLLMARRRRSDDDYATTTDVPVREAPLEPVAMESPAVMPMAEPEMAVAMPAMGAPMIEPQRAVLERPAVDASAAVGTVEDADVHEAADDDLVGLTDAPAPVANRPWIELGMRPVRAGATDEEALVEIELTVGNAGDQTARDVRVTTFMVAGEEASEMEQMLIQPRDNAAIEPVSIAPGEGTRIDATLTAPKNEVGRTFTPLIVADARYRLPDGREGRTSAAFRVGRPGDSGLGAIGASRAMVYEDVEAEFDRLIERV